MNCFLFRQKRLPPNILSSGGKGIRLRMATPALPNMSPEKLAMWQRRFNAIDLNKDGVISLREMAAVGRVLGYHFSVEELMVNIICKGTGILSFNRS